MESAVLDDNSHPGHLPVAPPLPSSPGSRSSVLTNALRRVTEAADRPPEETVAAFNNYI